MLSIELDFKFIGIRIEYISYEHALIFAAKYYRIFNKVFFN